MADLGSALAQGQFSQLGGTDIDGALGNSRASVRSALNAASANESAMTVDTLVHDAESAANAIARGASAQIKNAANDIANSMKQ